MVGNSVAVGDAHCPQGGVKYTSASGDAYVCNGRDGIDGATGADGLPGVSVTMSGLDAGDSHCAGGGVKLSSASGDAWVCSGVDGAPGVQGPPGVVEASAPLSLTGQVLSLSVGTSAGTVAAGDDPRFTDARAPLAGSSAYVQNGTSPQAGSFNLTGTGTLTGALHSATAVSAPEVLSTSRSGLTYDFYDHLNPLQLIGASWLTLANGHPVIRTTDQASGSAHLELPSTAAGEVLDPSQPYLTLAIWFRTSVQDAPLFIFNPDCNETLADHIWLTLSGGKAVGHYQSRFPGGSAGYSTATITSTASVSDGAWHQVVFVNDGVGSQLANLYVDGVAQGTVPAVPYGVGGASTTYVGYDPCFPLQPKGLDGELDGLRMYLRPLSAAEVTGLYQSQRPLFP